MPKIEVLVATMHQTDYSLLDKMNIRTDAIVVNQCDKNSLEIIERNGKKITWVNTTQRGLSKSRNMALSYASGDICLIADDDIKYTDDYEEVVKKAYKDQKKADFIAFNMLTENDENHFSRRQNEKNRKSKNNEYYCSVRLSFKLEKINKFGIRFNELFGAGSKFGAGEESIFIKACRKNGLKVYQNVDSVCVVDCSQSSWFNGFDEKYYFNKGAFLAVVYPKTAWFYKWYFVLQSRKLSSLKWKEVNKSIKEGIKFYKNL